MDTATEVGQSSTDAIHWGRVPPNEVIHAWPVVVPFVAEAVKHGLGELNADDIGKACMDGSMQLWALYRNGTVTPLETDDILGVLVTEVRTYPNKRLCEIILGAGKEIEKWTDYLCKIENWARELGCSNVLITGRHGWERVLKPHGYHRTYVTLSKDLITYH